MTDFSSMSDADLIKACTVDIQATTWVNDRPGPTTISAFKAQSAARAEARSRGLWYNGRGASMASAKLSGRSRRLAAYQAGKEDPARETGTSVKVSAKAASTATASQRAASAVVQPPRKLSRVDAVALAVRTDPKLRGYDDIALHIIDDPDLKGLSGDALVKAMQKVDPTQYRAAMAEEERLARRAKADAVWDKARGNIAPSTTGSASAGTVWDRARAAIEARRSAQAASSAAPPARSKASSDDVWARVYAKKEARA